MSHPVKYDHYEGRPPDLDVEALCKHEHVIDLDNKRQLCEDCGRVSPDDDDDEGDPNPL
jgi:hypothetical protein